MSSTEAASLDDTNGKVALVLEYGLRPDQRTAEELVAMPCVRKPTLADCHQRIEALRMYGQPLAGCTSTAFHGNLKNNIIPKLEFVRRHACVPNCLVECMCVIITRDHESLSREQTSHMYSSVISAMQWALG